MARQSSSQWTSSTSNASSISSSHSYSRGSAPSPSRGARSPSRGAPSPSRGAPSPSKGAPSPSRGSCSPARSGSSPTPRSPAPMKTLNRSTTIVNRVSTRSSPPILQRMNTSPNIRTSSTERNIPHSKGRNSVSSKLWEWRDPELGFSDEPPPNLRTSLSDRPLSNLRNGRSVNQRAQETRYHQEARHSYSESMIDVRQSHWQRSSSSASRLSSSTTSQDRWSSRGSIISSSDDGTEVIDSSFVDFSTATSPSSTSGTSRDVTGMLNSEAKNRYSPVISRHKKLTTSAETGRYSASARKSLESSMLRVDQHRASQNMFRPLLSSAPVTSFCNTGRMFPKPCPPNPYVEPSNTASSNASSEKGMRIFPSNESSDEEGDLESKSDRSLSAVCATGSFVLDGKAPIDEDYEEICDNACQYEHESLPDSASFMMDECAADGANYVIDTLNWEKSQPRCAVGSGEETGHSIKGTAHALVDEDIICSEIQRTENENYYEFRKENLQHVSTCLYPDSPQISCYGQNHPAEGFHECLECGELGHVKGKNFEAVTEICNIKQIAPSAGRLAVHNCYKNDQEQCLRIKQRALEDVNGACKSPITQNEDYDSMHFRAPEDVTLMGEEVRRNPDLQDDHIMDGSANPVINVLSLEESCISGNVSVSFNTTAEISVPGYAQRPQHSSYAIESTPSSVASTVASNPLPQNPENEQSIPLEGTITRCQHSTHEQELLGDLSNLSSTTKPQMPWNLHQLVVGENFCETEIVAENEKLTEPQGYCLNDIGKPDMETVKEPITSQHHGFQDPMLPENYLEMVNTFSEKCRAINTIDNSEAGSECQSIVYENKEKELHETLTHQMCTHYLVLDEKERTSDESRHANVPPSSLSQEEISDKQLQIDINSMIDSESCMSQSGENSSDCTLSTGVYEEKELQKSADNAISSCYQEIPQFQNELQSCSSPELSPKQTDLVEPAAVSEELPKEEIKVNPSSTTECQNPPQRGSPEKNPCQGRRASTHSFSLEEATNTILFCSSIVHDIAYKAASIAAAKEAEAIKAREAREAAETMKAMPPLLPASRGQNTNGDFINSLRGKVSRSATWKVRQKEVNTLPPKNLHDGVVEAPYMTTYPDPICGMDRDPTKFDSDKALPDNSKEKSFMGMSVSPNCQCTIM
ncbi:hypothetical protein KP509_05G007500 [Ceratopteris richardii]|nr:hypothetical protein KP509_05G007500 [Ceratopteris richardii]